MSESRTPVLRKPVAREELEKLGTLERTLLRLFEALSSVKLAVSLMVWLMVECTIGTFVESQVNTPAAGYFVYKTTRFTLLLALLGLNVLCAALIRFPWKRYQTGFLVTHSGLLLLLTGSMLTVLNNVDALMSVEKGKIENKMFDPSRERLTVAYHDRKFDSAKQKWDEVVKTEKIPVDFGPFTWGHKLFGKVPWHKDRVEEFTLQSGDVLRVKMFYANCESQRVYVPSENGVPAVKFRLYHKDRGFDMTQWLAARADSMTGSENFGMGSAVIWRVDTPAEFDHFVSAVPRSENYGLLGTLAYSHNGKHHLFGLDKLKAGPIRVPNSDVELRLKAYLPNAKLERNTGDWVTDGDLPENPLVRVTVKQGDKESELLAFGSHPEYSRLLTERFGREHLLTYFPADLPAVVQFAVAPDGKTAYRAFGSQGLIGCSLLEKDKEYPCWAGQRLVPLEILASANSEERLQAKPLVRAKTGMPGVVVELESGGTKTKAALMRGTKFRKQIGDRMLAIGYDIEETQLPFSVRLDDFDQPNNPGTRQAAMYTSMVTLFDKERDTEKKQVITMNFPLYHTDANGNDYTLYQSSISYDMGPGGEQIPTSTYTVARDPGLEVKYVGAIVLVSGIVLMFYMGGYFKRSMTRAFD